MRLDAYTLHGESRYLEVHVDTQGQRAIYLSTPPCALLLTADQARALADQLHDIADRLEA